MTDERMSPQERQGWIERAARWVERQATWEREHTKVAPLPAPKPQTAAKPKPTPASEPRRRGVHIQIDPEAMREPSVWERFSAKYQPPPVWSPTLDANDTDEPTPCSVCGGPVARDEAQWNGPWRQHPTCQSLTGYEPARIVAAARALAVSADLSLENATVLVRKVRCSPYATHRAEVEPCWTTEPLRSRMKWRHVDRKALVTAVEALPVLRIEAGLDPNVCTSGACAYCGRAESTGWYDDGHQWLDGTPAPLCQDCHLVYEKHSSPSPSFWDDQQHLAIAEAITGVTPQMDEGPPSALTAFAEVADADHAGDEQPWAHLPAEAVHAFRLSTWAKFDGAFCPPEHREEVMAHLAERRRVAAARAQEKAAEQAAKSNTFGF